MTGSSAVENGGTAGLPDAVPRDEPAGTTVVRPPAGGGTLADWPEWVQKLRDGPMSDWRAAVGEQILWLQTRCVNEASQPPCGFKEAMQVAGDAITAPRRRVRSWWSGWDAERAWRAVHAAEVELVAASSIAGLASRLPGIREKVATELPATDRRRCAVEQFDARSMKRAAVLLGDQGSTTGRPESAVVAEALRAAFTAADDALRRVRILRNQMLIFGALLVALNLVLGILGSTKRGLVPLCVNDFCPVVATGVTRADVWMVQLFGVFGAVIAVVMLLVTSQPRLITYDLTGTQSLVKIALGATLAVVGILGMGVAGSTFHSVIANRDTLLFIALLFGYSQQVATRSLDSTAERLVGKARTGVTRAS